MPLTRRARIALAIDVGAKVLVLLVLLFGVTHQDWSRFADKGIPARLVLYPLMLLIVPFVWFVVTRRQDPARRSPYPIATDLLVTAAFLIDTLGNLFDLYDSITWFDDLCHFLNWALLSAGIGVLLLRRRDLPPWILAWLVVGFGATSAILWEIAEYVAFVANGSEFATAYRDTMGDLTLGLSGSAVAAAITWIAAARRPSP